MSNYTTNRISVGLEEVVNQDTGHVGDVRSTGESVQVGTRYRDNAGDLWTILRRAETHAPYVFVGVRDDGHEAVFDSAGTAQSFFGGPSGPKDGIRLLELAE